MQTELPPPPQLPASLELTAALRLRAEAMARNDVNQTVSRDVSLSPEAAQELLFELRVHQIQQEMQNEKLRQVQLSLDAERERYFDLYDLAPVSYFTLSEKGLIVQSNLTAAGLLGLSRSDLSKQAFVRFVDAQDRAIFHDCVKRLEGGAQAQTCELRMGKSDGTRLWVQLAAIAAHDDGRALLRITLSDIGAIKLAQAELEQQRQHLEELVLSRTAELSTARDAAQAANIAKSAFLANMSHEIRTPMNGILGMANILRHDGVTPKQADRLDKIDISAQHLLHLINDVLDFAKIESGKVTLEETSVVLSDVIGNLVSLMTERVRAKGLRLLVQIESMPGKLLGDPTRLQQALLNYADNAIKFTEAGSITLGIRAQEDSAESTLLRFEVQDTGLGIAPNALSRLFSAFEQADNSTTRKYGGTGLGLAITRRLAELMGGQAGAQSTLGVGSTFWFTARLKKGVAEIKACGAASSGCPSSAAPTLPQRAAFVNLRAT